MRKPYRLAGGIVALVVGLLAFGSLHGWAGESPSYPVERKPETVFKNDKIDKNDEEIVAPEHLVIAGGNITITSRTFEPKEMNKGWRFKSFGIPNTHVDIHKQVPADGLSRYVVPPTATNDTATRIKVEAAGLVSDAGEWPLRCEGNLERLIFDSRPLRWNEPPPPPSPLSHWSTKMDKEVKAYAANAWWIIWGGHAAEMKVLIDNLGYTTLKEEPPTKASAVAAAPLRFVWYSLSDGDVDETGKYRLIFGWWEDYLYPGDLPAGLNYTLVFLNACLSSSSKGSAFLNAFGADAYVGWTGTVDNWVVVDFAKKFMGALKGRKTVQQAVTMSINSYDVGSFAYQVVVLNIKILRGANVVVDLSSN